MSEAGGLDDRPVRRPSIGSVGLLLPASWWTIDLRNGEARRRSVASLVEEQVGREDDRAALRADLRAQLVRAADDAAAAGGRMMAVSLMRTADVAVPATLTVYRLPGAGLDGDGVTELEAVLRASEGGHDSLELADTPDGPVLRRVGRRAGPVELGGEGIELLVVDYWLDPRDGHGLIYLAFSSPLLEVRDALLELFDTVVASIGPDDD